MDINNIVNSIRIRNARLLDDINNKILNREYYKFKYLPLEGALPGLYFQQQTEDAINDIGNVAYATEQVANEALKIAQQAYNIALAALETANNALAAAQTAQQTADTALNIAKNALSVGTAAATAAAAAQKAADAAQKAADAAKKAADAAQKTADAAQKAADAAANKATNALTKAEDALTKIEQLSVLNYYNNLTEATDVNTLVDIHRWYLQASNNPNAPEANPGFLNVDNDYNDSVCKQLWVSKTTGAIYNRFGQIVENSDPATVSSWSEWYKLATKADLDSTTTALTKKITTVANNLATHEADFNNPHKVTAEQLGLTTVYQYKGSVATYADLPTTGQKVGDVWNVETADPDHGIKAGDNVAWDGAQWDTLGGNHDLSGYAQLNAANIFTAANTFNSNIVVRAATAAGSAGIITLGEKPSDETEQCLIHAAGNGNLILQASENRTVALQSGSVPQWSVVSDEANKKTSAYLHSNLAATYTPATGVVWEGNANTATKLATARTINGVAFDGTANIKIADSTKLPIAGGTMTGDLTLKGNPTADLMAATKKYVDDSIANRDVNSAKYLNITNFIPSNSDFNDYKTPGEYQVQSNTEANTIANLPTSYNDATPRGGVLSVLIGFNAPRTSLVQIYRTYGSSYVVSRTYQRCFYNENSSWTAWREIACTDEVGLLNQANTFTGTNTFNKPITVRDGALAGSGGTITLGMKPNSATTQAKINSTTTGAMYYTATEGLAHFFNVGTTEVANIGGTATTATLNFLANSILKYSTSSGLRVGGGGTSKIIGFYPEAADNTAGMRLLNQAEAISTDYSIFSLQNNSAINYTKNAALQVGNFKILEVDRNNNNVTIKADSNGQILFTPNNLASNTSSIDSNGNFYISQGLTVGSTLNTGTSNGVIRAGNKESCLYFTGTAENTYFATPNTGNTISYQSAANCYLINCSINNPSSLNMNFSNMNFKATVGSVPYMCKTLTFWLPVGATVPAVTWTFPTGSAVYYPKGVAPTLTANANNIINVIAVVDDTGSFSIQVCETIVLPYSG